MPEQLKVAAVQFEMAENDKRANLAVMAGFIERARAAGCDLVCFPELCTTGYHFLTELDRDQILPIGEDVRTGPSLYHKITEPIEERSTREIRNRLSCEMIR